MPEPTTEKLKFSSLKELKEAANISERYYVKDESKLVRAFDICYKQGEENLKKGDEELAYIYFMRALNLYTCYRKSKWSQNKDEKFLVLLIGLKFHKSVEQLEFLDSNLDKQYKLKKQLNESSLANKMKKESIEQDDSVDNKLKELSTNPSYTNDVQCAFMEENKSSISSTELYSLLNRENPCTILILDIRLKEDFEKSSMKINDIVNIPQNIITSRNIATKLESLLEERFKLLFRKRGDYERVIVVDWSSKSNTNSVPQSTMSTMLKILNKYDVKVKYKSKPVMLEGGYEDWLFRYPTLTTNTLISPPKESVNIKFSLEKISYPTNALFEPEKIEKPLAPIATPTNPKPSIDRSTKPATFQEKKREGIDELKENAVEPVAKKEPNIAVTEDNVTKIVVKNDVPDTNPSVKVNGRRDSQENDDDELKKQFYRSGRRSALTENEVHSPLLNEKKEVENGESSRFDRINNCDETFRSKKAVNNIYNETGMKMKRYSSTPNISELGINESCRPPIDRSTKPSNDDQLNYYTTGYIYNEIGKGLTGLRNIGNTCYMNSILQCLSNTDPLRKRLCSWDMRVINENSKTRGAVAREIISIMKQLWSGDGGSITCKSLKNIIGRHNDMFSGHDQQDSHEFLTILIDWLHEDLNEPPSRQNLDGADEKSGEKAWGEFISKNNSIIRKLFYGQLRSTVSCNVCQKQSVTFEPFSNLSLSLPPEEIDKCSLADCLKLYISTDDVDKWQCPGCKELRRATKKLDITKLPPLLVIHFKRFTSVGGCKKQRTYVDFPDSFSMKPYVVGDEHRHQQFQLYAVSNHSGSMESGHYTAYCKNPADRRWYEFDDQNVYPMNSIPKSRDAYIVFYQTMKI